MIWDFNLKLPSADKSWVNIWVEGYSNGEAVEPFPLIELSYGLSPNQVEEGRVGFGIINPNSKEKLLFLYSPDCRIGPCSINNDFFIESGISGYPYAIGGENVRYP